MIRLPIRICGCVMALIAAGLAPAALAQSAALENQLGEAASNGQIAELERLVRAGANLKQSGALTRAVRSNQLNAVKYLVEHGADPNGGGSAGEPVYEAARRNNAEILRYLIDHGADIDAESPADSSIISTPLLRAVYSGDLVAARLLIKYGANVNRVSRNGNTALHQAIRRANGRSAEFIKLLLASGADPDIKDKDGMIALGLAKSDLSGQPGTLSAQPRPAPAPEKEMVGNAEDLQSVAFALMYKQICDARLPGFREKYGAAYTGWRSRNAAVIAQVEGRDEFRTMSTRMEAEAAASRPSTGGADARRREADERALQTLCEGELAVQFDKTYGSAPNSRFASPEKTWENYLAALRLGDRPAAVKCLTSTARDKFLPFITQASADQLSKMGNTVKALRLTGTRFDGIVEATAVSHDGRAGPVLFENVGGEWKISDM
ncbi:MAG: ankyrin repeat domain-containing protein [Rudaea sp.]